MSMITLDAATEKLTEAVGQMPPDELVQIYNELFPDEPAADDESGLNVSPLFEQIVSHFGRGLEPEEVVDLWNVAFPEDHDVYYNEEDGYLHVGENGD